MQRAQLHEDLLALLLGAAQRDHFECVTPTRRRAVPHQLDEAGAPLAQYTDVLERPEPLDTALAAGAARVEGGRRRRATCVERQGRALGVRSRVCVHRPGAAPTPAMRIPVMETEMPSPRNEPVSETVMPEWLLSETGAAVLTERLGMRVFLGIARPGSSALRNSAARLHADAGGGRHKHR